MILGRWADESKHAGALLRLALAASGVPGLPKRLRIFEDDQLARERLHGQLKEAYLPAMLAARRPVRPGRPDVEAWLQLLRVFLLIRAIEALEAGAIAEPKLQVACTATRKACDTPKNQQVTWLTELAMPTDSFQDFRDDLIYRTQTVRRPADWPTAAGDLYSKLRRLAAGGEWWDPRSLRGRALAADGVTGHADPTLPRPRTFTRPPLWEGTEFSALHIPAGKGQGTSVIVNRAKENSTPAQGRRHGTETLLLHVEESLYLPASWHHLGEAEVRALLERINALLLDAGPVNRVGAAIALIAIATQRSIFHAEVIRCTSAAGDDWTLDPGTWLLRRQPPRFERGIEVASLGEDAQGWVQPMLDFWEIELGASARAALSALPVETATEAPTLQALWQVLSPDTSLPTWFSQVLASTGGVERLTGPSTAHILPLKIFTSSQDGLTHRPLG